MTILPQLERDLFNAAQGRLPPKAAASPEQTTSLPRSYTGRLRRTAAGLPLILSAAVTIAIATVAIVVLRHRDQATTQSATPAGPPGGSPRAELIRTFGILRRRQTNADLDHELLMLYLRSPVHLPGATIPPGRYIAISGPPPVLKRWVYPELDRRLLRVVHIPAWTAKVLIAPTTFRPSPSSRNRSEGLDLAMSIGTTPTIPLSLIATGPQPASLGTLLAHGLALAGVAPGKRFLDAVYVVPDGVTSVQLGPFVSLPHTTPPGVSRTALNAALGAIHASTSVHDNIGALQLAVPVVTSRTATGPRPVMDGVETKAQAVWFNSHGQIIKRTTTRVGLMVRVEPKRTG